MNIQQINDILKISEGKKYIYDTSKTWVDLFIEKVKSNPNSFVSDSNSSITYTELNNASDKLAAYLINQGVNKNDFIAIQMGRVKEFLIAVLGIHKAGAAYVPIDLDYPAKRIDYMLQNSEAKIIITEKTVFNALKSCKPIENYRYNPDGIAYMIYTSGSTGNPKGVMIQHKALLNFVHFHRKLYKLNENSRIICHSSFSFDGSVEDLYPILTAGGNLFIVPEDIRRDIFEMRNFIEKNKITGGYFTTLFAQILATGEKPLNIDYISVGGEAMTTNLNVRGVIYNTYGPTEFTDNATYFKLEKNKKYTTIPIGRPLDNCAAFIVGENNELLPIGETGELCLSGAQLALGYWKLPELTAEKFTDLKISDNDIRKVYHTGDLAKYNEEGQLEYLGRVDFQVKIRGFRVEFGEIESCVLKYHGINQAAAAVKNNILCLYYTSSEIINEQELKSFMASSLADYMIPAHFIKLEKMPETPNGKLDRKALPEPNLIRKNKYVEPRNDTEKDIAYCMKKVLGFNFDIGIEDEFLELGGDSISAIITTNFLRDMGYSLKTNDILQYKTVKEIARHCHKNSDNLQISTEPIQGFIEDSAIFLYYKFTDFPAPEYYNQSTLLQWKNKADISVLQASFDAITYQHDMLRACIRNGHLFVKSANSHAIVIEEYFLENDSKDEIQKLCEDIQSNISIKNSLVRVALIHSGKRDLLFITAHHTIIDGVSWRILLSDIETSYAQILSGEPVKLPKKTHTYQDYALAMKNYRDSYILSLEIPYWQNVMKKLLAMEFSDSKDFTRHFKQLNVSMDKTNTDKFLSAKLSVYNLEINDLLLTAVCRSYRKIFNKNFLSVQLEGHGREFIGKELLTERTIGWFTSIYPVVFEELNGDFNNDLIRVKETLHRVPNKGVGFNILAFIDSSVPSLIEKRFIPKIVFNYLGNVSGNDYHSKFFVPDIKDGFSAGLDYKSSKNSDGSDIAINCLIDSGCFSLWLDYNSDFYDDKTASDFANEILNEINQISEYLENVKKNVITPSDLGETEWSIEEFNSVVAKFESRGEHVQRIFPVRLSVSQDMFLLLQKIDPDELYKYDTYRIVEIYELDFLPSENELRITLDALAKKHEVLRSAIIYKEVPFVRQAIIDRKLLLNMTDISFEPDKFSAALNIRNDLLKHGYDIEDKTLFQVVCAKTSENSCYIIIAVHHSIIDGWCTSIYMKDFEYFLQEARKPKGLSLSEVSESNDGIYEACMREILKKDTNKVILYCQKLLEGYNNKSEIPHDLIPENETFSSDDELLEKIIAPQTVLNFELVCREAGTTLANGFSLLFGMALQKMCNLNDVVFDVCVSGRNNFSIDVSNIVGLFMKTVYLRLKTEKNQTASSLLKLIHKQSIEINEFDFLPIEYVEEELGVISYWSLSFEKYYENYSPSILKPVLIREELEKFVDAITLPDGTIKVVFVFNPRHYRKHTIERLFSLIEKFMLEITNNPDVIVSSLIQGQR